VCKETKGDGEKMERELLKKEREKREIECK